MRYAIAIFATVLACLAIPTFSKVIQGENPPSAVNAAGTSTVAISAPSYTATNTGTAAFTVGSFYTLGENLVGSFAFDVNASDELPIFQVGTSDGTKFVQMQRTSTSELIQWSDSSIPTAATVSLNGAAGTFYFFTNASSGMFFDAPGGITFGSSGTKFTSSNRATATLSTTTVNANTCGTQSITVVGAAAGADCIVGGPATLEANLNLTCIVTATSTVQLRICNPSLGNITPAGSQTVGVRVFNP